MDTHEVARWWKHSGHAQLTVVLWAAWDPIGAVPLDEYENYADRLFSLLHHHEEIDRLADELEEIRTREMGLPKDRERDLEVAQKLGWWHYWAVEHRFGAET